MDSTLSCDLKSRSAPCDRTTVGLVSHRGRTHNFTGAQANSLLQFTHSKVSMNDQRRSEC